MVGDGASTHKIGDYKNRRASKSHYWFKSYGYFAEKEAFAYWWSCIDRGLRLQLVQQACLSAATLKYTEFKPVLFIPNSKIIA